MKCLSMTLLTFVLCISLNVESIDAAEIKKNAAPKTYSQWNGTWELSAKANKLLGYSNENVRDDGGWTYPTSITISIDEKFGTSINQEEVELMQKEMFAKIDQKIVATGTCETKFKVEQGLDKKCFITEGNGSTFLWQPAPFVVLYGGEVSLIQGKTADKDILVIDFDGSQSHLDGKHRSKDNVAFRRMKSKKQTTKASKVDSGL